MAETVMGWDLGGAHLKAAKVEGGCVISAIQLPCPLWQGLAHLETAMDEALLALGPAPRHAVTMTGEMADIFSTRAEGVAALTGAAARKLGRLEIFAGAAGLIPPSDAARRWREVASANWMASAGLVAAKIPEALFIDIGTTTTDIAPILGGKVRGATDAERLVSEELVYSGIVRTPVMAVAMEITFEGRRQGLMAEAFATMADAYRVAGLLPESADDMPAADSGGKTLEDSARRLARMLGRDAGDMPLAAWRRFAESLVEIQTARIEGACRNVSGGAKLGAGAPVIGAGCGSFLAQSLAQRLGRRYLDFAELLPVAESVRQAAGICAPAVAVACLAAKL
jgi:probable H4MPT-linked C1 transfer pathway protein